MKIYLFTSAKISKDEQKLFWDDVKDAIAPLKVSILRKDVSLGQPTGKEDAFAVHGSRADWEDRLADLIETGKPVFVRFTDDTD